MSLKRYLLISYLLTIVWALLAGAVVSLDNRAIQFTEWLLLAPLIAAAHILINILPWARLVPVDERVSFFSYKWTNIFFVALPIALIVLGACLSLVDRIQAS